VKSLETIVDITATKFIMQLYYRQHIKTELKQVRDKNVKFACMYTS